MSSELGQEESKDGFRLNVSVPLNIWIPQGLVHESSIAWLLIIQAVGLISLKQPNCQWEELMARAHERSPTKPLGVQPDGCCGCSFLRGST